MKMNLEKLNSEDTKVKYAFAKELSQMSEESPEKLYANFDDFVKLLDDDNSIIKWTAIDIIGHFSAIDPDNKIDAAIMNKLYELLSDSKVITCNHAIYALGLIAQNKPEHKEEIITKFLSVPDNDFETDECEAIATGKVLEALQPFIAEIKDNKRVIDFVKNATNSTRNSTVKKANEFLKNLNQ